MSIALTRTTTSTAASKAAGLFSDGKNLYYIDKWRRRSKPSSSEAITIYNNHNKTPTVICWSRSGVVVAAHNHRRSSAFSRSASSSSPPETIKGKKKNKKNQNKNKKDDDDDDDDDEEDPENIKLLQQQQSSSSGVSVISKKLDEVNPVGLGRRSRQIFDEVWRKFSGLGQISRTSRTDDESSLLIREGDPMCEFAIPGAQNTTVLVVGSTSRVGRIVVRKLMLRGYTVKVPTLA